MNQNEGGIAIKENTLSDLALLFKRSYEKSSPE
jgi:hypothetical protein